MTKKIQISVVAGALLIPTILTPIAEAAPTMPTSTSLPTAATMSTDPAELKQQLITLVHGLTELATREQITLAQSYITTNQRNQLDFTTEELELLTEKVKYINAYFTYRADIQALGTKLAPLLFTHTNLVDAYEASGVKAAYNDIDTKMTATNKAYKDFLVVDKVTPALIDQFVGQALQYGNSEVNQKKFFVDQGLNVDHLLRVEQVVGEIKPTIDKLKTFHGTQDSKAADELAREIRTDYNKTSVEGQNAIASFTMPGESKPVFTLLTQTEQVASEVEAVRVMLEELKTKHYKTSADYLRAVKATEAAYYRLTPVGQGLIKAELDAFVNEATFIEEVAKLRPSNKPEYRTQVDDLAKLGASITARNKIEVDRALEIIEAQQQLLEDVLVVEKAIAAITSIDAVQAARADFEKLDKEAQRLVANAKDLSTWERQIKALEKLDDQLEALHPADKSFATKTLSAKKTLDKYTEAERGLLTYAKRLETFVPLAELEQAIKKLKPTHYDYANELKKLRQMHSELKNDIAEGNLKEATAKRITQLDNQISVMEDEKKVAADVIKLIDALDTLVKGDKTTYIKTMIEARAKYNDLPASARKVVANSKDLATHEKDYKAVLRVIDMIDTIDEGAKNFTSKVKSAKSAYDKLPTVQQAYVTNYAFIEEALIYSDIIEALNKLRPTTKTFREDTKTLRTTYDALQSSHQAKVFNYGKLLEAEGFIKAADDMDTRIMALETTPPEKMVEEVAKLGTAYKAMDSNIKRLVQNGKILTDFERENKTVIKVVQLIQNLDPGYRDYAKRVTAARKAYDNLTPLSKARVTNYKDLVSVEPVAYLIGDIAALKPTNKTFAKDVERLRKVYEALTKLEQGLITNLDLLVEAEQQLGQAAEVITLIDEAIADTKHEDYMKRLTAARIAFDRLSSQQKRLVSNQKELTMHERAVKPVLNTMVLIERIDPEMDSFIKDTAAARNAYGKLDRTQRALVSNYDWLQYHEPVAKVTELISKIKPASKTYHDDTEKSRALYNALDDERKALVPNLDILLEAEKNIASASDIDELIASLPNSPAEDYLKNVQTARNVYNGLSAERKRAVKNYSLLQAQEKIAKPVQDVVNKIDAIFTARDMAKQYQIVMNAYDKLDATQRKYVYNAKVFLTLTDVIKVHDKIEALKPSDPNYFGLVQLVRKEYNQLSSADKQRVSNYNKLLEAEAQRALLDKVMETIARISPTSSDYFTMVEDAQAAYVSLPTALRKHIINYDKLDKANKDVTAARKVIDLITSVNEDSPNFEKQVLAAQKAYDALTSEQRRLIHNAFMLEDYLKQL
ncbi:hypothetical protein BN1050_01086 [Metalysinibacillus saudimassiliensis]|uniref:Septation ring formation regulator EzrA n=1 Tax=Metalysinibacillus saudimassiliensis TaxID=1461583 RepID=A0A078M317_9BACL|nr:hypothetical protein BN1050_01086 [Metalysinibacillus saudimassiliensis]